MQIHIEKNQKEIKEHGSFAFPVNVSIENIQSYEQSSFLWHWHPEIELTWIVSGEMEYHVNDRQYILKEGEGLFGNSNTLHSGYMKDGKECTYLSVTFHPRFLYGYENSILQTKYVDYITENEEWASLHLEKNIIWHQEILYWVKKIYEMSQEPPVDFELQVHMQLLQIWQKLYQYFASLPEREKKPQLHLQRLRDIVSYIQEHYAEEISLEEVAEQVNICKSECCRFFKKHMNMTIFDYILFLRIQKSLPLLKSGESVTEVAGRVGFSSPAYYGQIFKRYMKCTPREYKKSE
ncbi:helix-turn-helix transcriptional regulator [Faecalicatena contorta]|uniref:helix-turn-helix domain-containing protein n=1 Tax=Faecalicatena contorta TaxID=39482 RepID=UPI001F1AF0AB|nr:AraC family transcriptional regulator [Faecalicatena contorta]MCF2679413.1 helix-turn-helix transcriptional regulator [Faecalicatena contorta]